MSEAELIELVRKIPLEEGLIVLSWLNNVLSQENIADWNVQEKLINTMLEPELKRKIISFINQNSGKFDIVFHFQQIFICSKYILQYGSKKSPNESNWLYYLGRALFSINESFEESNERILSGDELAKIFWLNLNFGAITNNNNVGIEIARAYKIFNKIPKGEKIYEIFNNCLGFQLDTYWSILFLLYSRHIVGEAFNKSRIDFLLKPGLLYSKVKGVDPQQVERVFDFLSSNLEEINKSIHSKQIAFKNFTYDFMCFLEKPLLKFRDGEFVCLSFPHLVFFLSRGIFELLRKETAKEQKDELGSAVGAIFQGYVENELKGFFPSYRLHFGKRKRIEISDGIIDYGDKLVWLEVKAMAIKKGFKLSDKIDDIEKGLKDFLTRKGARQLHKNISRFRDGEIKLEGVEPSKIKEHWPVIISCLEEIPQFSIVRKIYNDILSENGLLQDDGIKPLIILNITDFDLMLYCMNIFRKSFIELLKGFLDNPHCFSFQNYLYDIKPQGIDLDIPTHLSSYWVAFCDRVDSELGFLEK